MIDVLNYTIYGYPVFIYTLMITTAGALTYATLASGASGSPAPAAAPAPAPAAPAAAPAPATQAPAPQGGRKHRKSKRRQNKQNATKRK